MPYYDPYDLVVGVVASRLEDDCKTAIKESDISRVDVVARYDLSGDPTKPNQTANKIIVKPDEEIGENRGDRDLSHAIGVGVRTKEVHVEVEIDSFPLKTTRDKDKVRDIIARISGRVEQSLNALGRDLSGATDDAHWRMVMIANPYIQGGGIRITDAGPNKAIRGRRSLIVGYIVQYIP